MLGVIIGDIVGSRFEFANAHHIDFELFARGCGYTDDTICTIAIVDVLLREAGFADALQTQYGHYPHPKGAYDGHFRQWVYTTPPIPYHNFGNDNAMHVSPYDRLSARDAVLSQAKTGTECIHNHPEGIREAAAIAKAAYLLRGGVSKTDLKKRLGDTYYYNLTQSVDCIRGHNNSDKTC